ncbi:MAG: polysaccharide deacetylase family protein [Clostridiales bacterium]|nr:polysaccharide deacetylase family protein [Clostridiales bacterium]
MSFYIFNRRQIAKITACTVMAILALIIVFGGLGEAVPTAAGERKIPIYCVDTTEKKVSISFDAAWGNEQTQTLLDILDEYNVKATFFLVGMWADKYPESVKDIALAGHDVGSHSSVHDHMTQHTVGEIIDDTMRCNVKLRTLTGKEPTLYRCPYGDYNNDVVQSVNDCNMYCIQWDVDSLDWKDPSPDEIVSRIKSKITNGSIILMHNGAKNTPEALPKVIEAIQSEGYEIVPISELLIKGSYYTDSTGKMHQKADA